MAVPVASMRLAILLVRFRWWSLWNGMVRVPRARGMRVAWILVLAAPMAYVGLLANALEAMAAVAGPREQIAAVALFSGALALASTVGKMATSETVVAGTAENELLLTRPIGLETLVTARSLSGPATDLFDAFFLFPTLVAASLVFGLGGGGVAIAVATSIFVQMGITATAQTGQILVVQIIPAPRRRMVWSLLALASAATVAGAWGIGTWMLRQPEEMAARIASWADLIVLSPAGTIAAPLFALKDGSMAAAVEALLVAAALSALSLTVARAVARRAARAGWEPVGPAWAEASLRPRTGAGVTAFGKDWRLIVRDRSRLVLLVALPVVFVTVQILGGAGWGLATARPAHVGVVAFSLVAYLATFGPLVHMQAERGTFWILRAAPVSLGRLMAWKATFWSVVLGGLALVCYAGVILVADKTLSQDVLVLGALVVIGAVTVAWLGVAMGCAAADLADDRRGAVGIGTIYLFLSLAGLFNVVLMGEGALRARALILYLTAIALIWITGMEQALLAYDPELRARRRIQAGEGAVLAILLFLGGRVQRLAAGALASGDIVLWADLVWALMLAVASALYLLRRRATCGVRWRWWRSTLATTAIAALLILFGSAPGASGGAVGLLLLLVTTMTSELIVRGIVQRALHERWASRAGRAAACAVATIVALAITSGSNSTAWLLGAVMPGLAFALTGRLSSSWIVALAVKFAW